MAGLNFLPTPLGNLLPSLGLVQPGAVGFAVAFGHLLLDSFHRTLAWVQAF